MYDLIGQFRQETGTSLYECNGHAVAIALRSQYPSLVIIIAADDYYVNLGNPGPSKATAAAQAAGGVLALPVFQGGRGMKTMCNDNYLRQALLQLYQCPRLEVSYG